MTMRRYYRPEFVFLTISILVSMLVVLIGMTANTSYTYQSKATVLDPRKTVAVESQPIVYVEPASLPECVAMLSHLPQLNGSGSCYAEIECAGVESIPDDYCAQSDFGLTCQVESCVAEGEWIAQAAQACGCGESVE